MQPARLPQMFVFLLIALLVAACSSARVEQNAPATPFQLYLLPPDIPVTRMFVQEFVSVESAPEPLRPPNGEVAPDMFFEDYGVNPFIDTEDDNLSTFAVDVDTGAYTVMRRYINGGNLPPDESVRVEEYVNYFAQDYARPDTGAFGIHLEGAPTPYGETDRYHLLRVGLQGYAVDPAQRPDAMLIFVIDVSGSMDMENRLELVKAALVLLLDNLRPTDRVGIVIYGSTGRVLLEPIAAEFRSEIRQAIDQLRPEGVTNAEEGLRLAYELADRHATPNGINRIILCSDGVANVGNTAAESILTHAARGIQLSTFGFGMGNYNDVLMEQLADQGDGSYAYIDDMKEAERVFNTQLTTTLLTIAKDAKVQVEFNPAVVERYRLLGYENRDVADADFRNDAVDAGEIGAGHSVTALYELKLAPDADPSAQALQVSLRYVDLQTAAVQEINRTISVAEFAPTFEQASPRFQLNAVVAEYAEILRNSYWAKGNSLFRLLPDVERVGQLLPQDADVQEFVRLVGRAAQVSE